MIIAVSSMKGGVGKTETALNLAIAIKKSGRNVILLDFDIPYGGVAQALGETKEISVTDWIKTNRKIGIKALKSLVAVHDQSGLNYIPAIQNAEDIDKLNADVIQRIIGNLNEIYDCIVVDTGVDFSMPTKEALKLSDHIIIVTTPNNVSAQNNYRYKEDLIRHGTNREKLKLFINMILKNKNEDMVDKIVQAFNDTGTPIETVAAVYHEDTIRSVREEHGFIYTSNPNSSFAKGINMVMKKLGVYTPNFSSAHESPKRIGLPGFLRRLAWWAQ